jgi:hypothetical protein
LFTTAAVKAIAISFNSVSPAITVWFYQNIDLIAFVYAFTWIFVLSSVIPSLLLGKKRGILVQYILCLAIAVLALSIQGLIVTFGGITVAQLFSSALFVSNPILAGIYLSIPYLFMLLIDIFSRNNRKSPFKVRTSPKKKRLFKTFHP